jgi:hypothetical protein
MIRAPAASSSSGDTDFTEPLVPTGINTGVSTTPWEVRITPARARDSVDRAINSNENMVVLVVYGPVFVVIKFRYYIFLAFSKIFPIQVYCINNSRLRTHHGQLTTYNRHQRINIASP